MPSSFAKSVAYLQRHYMAQVGPIGVCAYGALVILLEEGITNPTYELVASMAGCKEWTLRTALDKLTVHNIITKVKRSDRKGSKLSNLYKLNDPDSWTLQPLTPGLEITASPPALNFTASPVVNFTNGGESEASTSVSETEVSPGLEITASPPALNFTALSSSSSSFLSLDPLETTKKEDTTKSTLPSFSNSGSRDLARMTEPPKPPSMNDTPFQQIERMWFVNCGKVNAATEEFLWSYYLKYGVEMLTEGLKVAFANNTRGDKPSMRFVEAILDRLDREKRADDIRRKELEYQKNPQTRPDTSSEVFANTNNYLSKLYHNFKASHSDEEQKEDSGNE